MLLKIIFLRYFGKIELCRYNSHRSLSMMRINGTAFS